MPVFSLRSELCTVSVFSLVFGAFHVCVVRCAVRRFRRTFGKYLDPPQAFFLGRWESHRETRLPLTNRLFLPLALEAGERAFVAACFERLTLFEIVCRASGRMVLKCARCTWYDLEPSCPKPSLPGGGR